jgi:hypothetical protein
MNKKKILYGTTLKMANALNYGRKYCIRLLKNFCSSYNLGKAENYTEIIRNRKGHFFT